MSERLLFVGSTLDKGGIPGVISNLTLELQKRYDIDILLNNEEKMMYPYGGTIISLGVKQPKNVVGLWFQFKVLLKRCVKLYQLKKSGKYLACISMMDSANVANILTKSKLCKTVAAVYTNITSGSFKPEYKYIVGPLARIFYNYADKIIVTSKGVMRDLEVNYKVKTHKMQVIYDGINIEEVREQAAELLEESDRQLLGKYTISALGRLDYPKGYRHLIRSMKLVRKKYPNVRLLIMGTGSLHDELDILIEECSLRENITLCGYTVNPYKFIANSSVYVMSSIVEGFPTVLLEAITCGTPVVSTDMESGAREILAPDSDIYFRNISKIEYAQYGVLVPVCDGKQYDGSVSLTEEEEKLGWAVINLLDNIELRKKYKEKYREYSSGFSRQACAEEWIRVFQALQNSERRG